MFAYIELDQPFDPGDRDPGQTYPHCIISMSKIRHKEQNISIQTEYGTMTSTPVDFDGYDGYDGYEHVWTRGLGSLDMVFRIPDSDFEDVIVYPPENFEEALHQWIVDNGKAVGVVVVLE